MARASNIQIERIGAEADALFADRKRFIAKVVFGAAPGGINDLTPEIANKVIRALQAVEAQHLETQGERWEAFRKSMAHELGRPYREAPVKKDTAEANGDGGIVAKIDSLIDRERDRVEKEKARLGARAARKRERAAKLIEEAEAIDAENAVAMAELDDRIARLESARRELKEAE